MLAADVFPNNDEGAPDCVVAEFALEPKPPKVLLLVVGADGWIPKRNPDATRVEPSGPLWTFAEKISLSRREGKNRRDGATVIHRVLDLADVVGATLWEDAVADEDKP